MDWRRKDSTYAAATAVAAALVAYIVAGNFGLVPSPLSPAAIGGGTPVAVAPTGATATSPPGPTVAVAPEATVAPPSAPPPPVVLATDTIAPSGSFTTQDGLSAPIDEGATVSGRAADTGSGVRDVLVTFTPESGASTTRPADLTCNATRSSCTWSAKVPGAVAGYTVTAEVHDRAGNARKTGSIDVTVLNVGGVLDNLSNGGAVGSVVGAVRDLLSL